MSKITDYVEQTSVAAADVILIDGAGGTHKIKLSEAILKALDAATPTEGRAALHNSIYRGKKLGTAVSAKQWAAIAANTFDDIWLGDYWTIGSIDYRAAFFDGYLGQGDTAFDKPHIVMVPDQQLYTAKMNDANTTEGGYAGSAMVKENLESAKTTIKNAFGEAHVLSHRIMYTNAMTDGHPSAGSWYDSLVDLMTERNVYGDAVHSPRNDGVTIPYNYTVDTSQFPLFAANHKMINPGRYWYWLRDLISASGFAGVGVDGVASYGGASGAGGVRPAFCIG